MRSNEALAEILEQMAFLAELKEENPFKVRALANAAGIVAELATGVEELVRSGEITSIKGIGKGTQAIAREFLETGAVRELAELQEGLPATILELREVRGLGPKKIKKLHDDLGIGSLSELEYACEENRLLGLKGFGEKTQASVLKSVRQALGNRGKVILPIALREAESALGELAALAGLSRVELTGEVRRHAEIVSAVDFLVEGSAKALAKAGFEERHGAYERRSEHGVRVRVFAAEKESFGTRLLETTGPAEFVSRLGELPEAESEPSLFARMKRPFVPAECRELGLSPKELVEERDIQGVFHVHTTWSDGRNTLDEMAAAAEKLGFSYLGVSDHSQTAFYARGLDEKRVLEQRKEIEAVQERYPRVRLFRGIESDILADGALDYPKKVLESFDFVIASVHGQMKMSRADMTKRLCTALRNPATTWLGHWTGRLLLGREGYDFDVEEVLKCAAGEGKSIELNANPYRLDVDWRLLPRLAELGIPVGIHPDAHSAGGLADTKFGVWMARKAGLGPRQVLNTKSVKEMESWLAKR